MEKKDTVSKEKMKRISVNRPNQHRAQFCGKYNYVYNLSEIIEKIVKGTIIRRTIDNADNLVEELKVTKNGY